MSGTGKRKTWRGPKRVEVMARPCPRCGEGTEYKNANHGGDTVRACTECSWKVLVSGRTGTENTDQ